MRRTTHRQLITKPRGRKWLVPDIAMRGPARQKFVQQAVHGILACGSLILSEMARSLRETSTRFLYVLKRFSRQLGSKAWDPSVLHAEVLERNAAWVYQDTPVMVDLSEIAKPYARRMPHLCTVRDASSTDKRKTPGYWLPEGDARRPPPHAPPVHRARRQLHGQAQDPGLLARRGLRRALAAHARAPPARVVLHAAAPLPQPEPRRARGPRTPSHPPGRPRHFPVRPRLRRSHLPPPAAQLATAIRRAPARQPRPRL